MDPKPDNSSNNLSFPADFTQVRKDAAVDIGQLHYLIRQLSADGQFTKIDDQQRDEVFELLEKAVNSSFKINDYHRVLSSVSALTLLVGPEKVLHSPIYRTLDNNWSKARTSVIVVMFLSLALLVLFSAVFNKAKISHDRIFQMLSEENLSQLAPPENGKREESSSTSPKSTAYRQSVKAEIIMASSVVYSKQYITGFVTWIVNVNPPVGGTASDTVKSQKKDEANNTITEFRSDPSLQSSFVEGAIDLEGTTEVQASVYEANVLLLSVLRRHLEQMIYVLASFLLPITYGVFGASVFLLRESLPAKSANLTIQISLVHVFLRVGLGAVMGIVVGLFTITENIREMTATPFAVAFLAGFSLDLVFSFLERFISAFSSNSDFKQKT